MKCTEFIITVPHNTKTKDCRVWDISVKMSSHILMYLEIPHLLQKTGLLDMERSCPESHELYLSLPKNVQHNRCCIYLENSISLIAHFSQKIPHFKPTIMSITTLLINNTLHTLLLQQISATKEPALYKTWFCNLVRTSCTNIYSSNKTSYKHHNDHIIAPSLLSFVIV